MKHIYLLFVTIFAITTAQAQIIDIPDANFKNALVNTNCVDTTGNGYVDSDADINNDGEIQISEAESFLVLNVRNESISSLEGIEYFSNLIEMLCDNNNINSLDLSSNQSLETLSIGNNSITSIDLSQVPNLLDFNCSNNPNLAYDLSQVPNLLRLNIYNIEETSLDLNLVPNLTTLNCANNELTSLDLSNLTNLSFLNCGYNLLTSLDLNNSPNLQVLYCTGNLLTSLDTSNNSIHHLYCQDNQITYLNIKDGLSGGNYYSYFEDFFDIRVSGNQIEYICVDDFGYESQFLAGYNRGTYCSFVPGGNYYTFEGNTKVDFNMNGCDASDNIYPNLKFNISDGTNDGSFISNTSGDYSFPVTTGIHTITPELEFSDYFTVSPASVTADFPTDASPFIQDFCFTPNGTHNDLEVTIIPLNGAIPGFESNYKFVYKNKGNTTLSGNIDLTFQDELMDLVSDNPNSDSQTVNNLSWNYTNLQPFENREILIKMNLNTPTDTLPLNDGDTLNFTATINPQSGDETPEDNVFTLNQTVVNSYDPNDKTCLEGDTITTDLIGKDVHYVIRFENTGTADAINVVVKDIIDTAKFDTSTLFLTDSSHDVVTRITSTNVVEFIFENINLPFDDANNDGYIAFKIKTLDTLVAGDTFENDAEIYFDYNFPIDTNVALTTIESTLGVNEESLAHFEIYPNPVNNRLFIDGLETIKSVTIYDISGRMINQVSYIGNHNNIEISTEKLVQGTYFVKVKTDVGEFVKKVVKE